MKTIAFVVATVLLTLTVSTYKQSQLELEHQNAQLKASNVQIAKIRAEIAEKKRLEEIRKAEEARIAEEQRIEAERQAKLAAANSAGQQIVDAGPCSTHIAKYGWNQRSAHAVMMQESSNNPRNANYNAATGDHSIGCFQINLKGEDNLRAKYRDAVALGYTGPMDRGPLEIWLKNAANNVAVAYKMYQSSGWGPWSNHTCKVVVCS